MRPRWTIGLALVFLLVLSVRPADAGGWSAFVAWLSKLDPGPSTGIGAEVTLQCLGPAASSDTRCTFPREGRRLRFKVSTSLMVGDVDDQPGKAFVWPTLGIVEARVAPRLYLGGGLGVIHVGGLPDESVTRPLLQGRVTLELGDYVGLRSDFNLIPRGFPANAFGPGSAATGTEGVIGLALVWTR